MLELQGRCGQRPSRSSVMWENRTKRNIDNTMVEPLFLELRENEETVEIHPQQDRVDFGTPWVSAPWRCQAIALLPPAERDDNLSPVAMMGVLLGYDRTIVNGFRVGLLEDISAKRRHFRCWNSNVRIEEDTCGFLTKEIERSELPEQRGQRLRREDEGIETNQQDENEEEMEKMVDRILAETNSDARLRSPVQNRREWRRNQGGANRDHMTHAIRHLHIQVTVRRHRVKFCQCSNCCTTPMVMNHDWFKETDTVPVCTWCVQQLENSGGHCAREAASNLEVQRGGRMCFLTRLQPTRAMVQQEIGREKALGEFLRLTARTTR